MAILSTGHVMLALVFVGFISILAQVVLLRELNVALYGVELIYLVALGFWLLWTGLGASLGSLFRSENTGLIARTFLLLALLLPAAIAFTRSARILFSAIPGGYLPFHFQLITIAVALLPIGTLSGLLFPLAASCFLSVNRTLPQAYALESLGGLAGGLFATIFFYFGLQNFTMGILCSLVCVVIASLLRPRSAKLGQNVGPILLLTWTLVVLFFSRYLDSWMTRWVHPGLLDTRDTAYGRITLTGAAEQISVFENDALVFETQETGSEELVHLAALQHPELDRVLLIGGGSGGVFRQISQYRPTIFQCVEINRAMLEMVGSQLEMADQFPQNIPNLKIHIGEPRPFLKVSQDFDLILLNMPEPDSGQANRFYTLEFFTLCRNRLRPGGILAFRLQSAENFWTPHLIRKNASIFKALKKVFLHTLVVPAQSNIFIASSEPLTRDPEFLLRRLKERKIATQLVSAAYLRYLFLNERLPRLTTLLEEEIGVPNNDLEPVCYRYALLVWLSRFFPKLTLWSPNLQAGTEGTGPILLGVGIAVLLPLIYWLRRMIGVRRIVVAAVAGFYGMIIETVLILYYQIKTGVLYQDIGILLMSFMAGLAAGSEVFDRLARTRSKLWNNRRLLGMILTLTFLLFNFSILLILPLEATAKSGSVAILLGLTGVIVAGLFTYASYLGVSNQRTVAARLYSADLLGGAIATFVGSLFLIPFLGLARTVWWMNPIIGFLLFVV